MNVVPPDKSLDEIGKMFNITRERVRQIERRALRKLRDPVRSDILREFEDLQVDRFWVGESDGCGNRRYLPKPTLDQMDSRSSRHASCRPKEKRMNSGRFDYVKYDDKAAVHQQNLKLSFEILEQHVERTLMTGRAKALVLTKLEEAYMWVGKAIRDEQIARGGDANDQPLRGDAPPVGNEYVASGCELFSDAAVASANPSAAVV